MDFELTSEDIEMILELIEEAQNIEEDHTKIENLERLYRKLFNAYHQLNEVEQ